MNSRFAKTHKKTQEQKWLKNLTIWKKLKEKIHQISALFSTQRPPDALDHLPIGLAANEYTKDGKTSENLLITN